MVKVVTSLPESVRSEQLWVLVDARNPSEPRRCYFPNRAMVERAIKTMLHQNPEVGSCPADFAFVFAGTLAFYSGELLFMPASSEDKMEFITYAS